MLDRYSRDEMKKIWSDENKFKKMYEVEIAVLETLARQKIIPSGVSLKLKKNIRIDSAKIRKIEHRTKHETVAFLEYVEKSLGPGNSKYLHFGLTSSDLLDTTLSIQMKEASEILLKDTEEIIGVLKSLAKKYKYTLMAGRTHGIHAEPITLGFKYANWYDEFLRAKNRIKNIREGISVGKISGAVGTYTHINPEVEKYVCKKFSLKPAGISTQIISRDIHAEYLATLALVASSIEKFATEIRGLQRTEIAEMEEHYSANQVGSSAMPHKHNPVTCEQLCGLARVVRANVIPSYENIVLWNERDISHSSSERIIIEDSTVLLDYMLKRFCEILKKLIIHPENMLRNLSITKGRFFSQRVLIELMKKGLNRFVAHQTVRNISEKSISADLNFEDAVKSNATIRKYLGENEIDNCFDLKYYTRHIDRIFRRLKI